MPESGYYAAAAGLIARTDALDVAANNLANINSSGYKAQREYFSSLVAGAANTNANPLNKAVNDYSVLGGARVDIAPGNMERTFNDLDLAIEGTGFFQVQTSKGTRFTRDGNFRLSSDRQLQSQNGEPVLNTENQPIQLPLGKVAISSDGTVSIDNNIVARLGVVNLTGATLIPEGSTNFAIQGGTVQPATDSSVRQGMLEAANLSPVAASVGLITIQRYADMMFRTLNIFHTEFNKSAAEDLPRV